MSSPRDTWSDEQLAAAAQGGSAACFELLVRRYQVRLLRFLLRSLRQADAEDVMQDAFVQAYQNLHRYSSRWRFKTWLFVIGQRLMIDHLRRTRRAPVRLEEEARTYDDHAAAFDNRERRERLWPIAQRVLGDEAYRAVWLHYVEELDTREVARVLGRSWVWVKTALHRARRKLEPHFAKLEATESSASRPSRPIRVEAGEPCQTTA